MKVEAIAAPTSTTSADWPAILAEVNAWRGSCIHHVSAIEMAVTETLLTLSSAAPAGQTVRLRQLIGQRFSDLAEAIGPDGPFAKQGAAAATALAQYRESQEAFRALLCHGAIKVLIEQNGRWTLIIRSLSIRSRQAEPSVAVLDDAEAQTRLATLKRDAQQLSSQLGQLRKTIAP